MPSTPQSAPVVQYAIYCIDAPDGNAVRARTLESHKKHVEHWASCIVVSGPLLAEDGITREGQLYVVQVTNYSEAERFVAEDPFTIAGLFQHISIRRFSPRFEQGQRSEP